MPPPLPPAQLGHSLGPLDATVTLGGHLDYVVCAEAFQVAMKLQCIDSSLYNGERECMDVQCPYSKKTYQTIRKQVSPHYRDQSFRFVFHHQVQP